MRETRSFHGHLQEDRDKRQHSKTQSRFKAIPGMQDVYVKGDKPI